MNKSSELDRTVKLYILSCIHTGIDNEPLTKCQDKINYINERFYSEYHHFIKRVGKQQAMSDWLRGLALDIDFTNYDIIKLAEKWGSITTDASSAHQQKILDNYWTFMAVKTLQIIEGYRVPCDRKNGDDS